MLVYDPEQSVRQTFSEKHSKIAGLAICRCQNKTDGMRLPRFREVKEKDCMQCGEFIAAEITKIPSERYSSLSIVVMLFCYPSSSFFIYRLDSCSLFSSCSDLTVFFIPIFHVLPVFIAFFSVLHVQPVDRVKC